MTRTTAQRAANKPDREQRRPVGVAKRMQESRPPAPTLAAPLAAPIRPARRTVFQDDRNKSRNSFMVGSFVHCQPVA